MLQESPMEPDQGSVSMGKRARPWLLRRVRMVSLLAAAGACGTTKPPAPPPAPAAPPAPPGMQVTKQREELQVAPWDLVFSGVRGAADATETVSARNLVDHVVEVRAILVVGEQSAVFRVRDLPELPARLAPKGKISAGVAFAPGAD